MYSYNYGIEESILDFMEEFGYAILGVALIVILVALVISVLTYVFRSVGLYTIAKRRGIKHAWLSWIPVGSYWIAGSIADQYQYVARGQIRNKRKILLVLCIASVAVTVILNVLSSVSMIMMVNTDVESAIAANGAISVISSLASMGFSIAVLVFWHMALYDIYSSCVPDSKVALLVLGIIFSITIPFFLFFNRKKDYGMPPRRPEPQNYAYQQPQYAQSQEPWNNQQQF